MKRNKVIAIVALVAVLAVAATVLAACNVYEWDSIGGGDSSAAVVSNGGYYVEQGKYVYFINGYVGSVTENEWGAAFKQSIMRAEKNEDGTINNDTAKVVVPLNVYNEYVDGGIAVFGDWIYYATPNTSKDSSGTASTTHTDFMRTRTDGSVTQRIGTVSSRSSEYFFTPTRILYMTDSSTVRYFDFSGMSTDKSIDDGKGAVAGVLIENAGEVLWGYDADRAASSGVTVTDYIFYTETPTGDDSYRHYNNLCAVRYDGSDRQVLATYDTFFGEEDGAESYEKVFTYALSDIFYDSDNEATLYYTKSVNEGGTSSSVGLFVNTVTVADGKLSYTATAESQLFETAPSAFFPLGGENGVLATSSDKVYHITSRGQGYTADNLVIDMGEAVTVRAVVGDYVYYTDGDGVLYRINLEEGKGDSDNVRTVVASGIRTDYLTLEFAGDRFVWFNEDDYDYLYYLDLGAAADGFEGKMMGVMTDADAEAKAEAEEEAE